MMLRPFIMSVCPGSLGTRLRPVLESREAENLSSLFTIKNAHVREMSNK